MPPKKKTVVVCGDVTCDWLLKMREPVSTASGLFINDTVVTKLRLPGGAALLGSMIAKCSLIDNESKKETKAFDVIKPNIHPKSLHDYHHCYGVLRQYGDQNEPIWRIQRLLGSDDLTKKNPSVSVPAVDNIDLLVISDGNLGYRKLQEDVKFPIAKLSDSGRIILRMTGLAPKGSNLWSTLTDPSETYRNRLTCVTHISHLLNEQARIRLDGSWESLLSGLYREMLVNPQLNHLLEAKTVHICIGTTGVLSIDRLTDIPLNENLELTATPESQFRAEAVFNASAHGFLEISESSGKVMGMTMSFVASMALLDLNSNDVSRPTMIQRWIESTIACHEQGYKITETEDEETLQSFQVGEFPFVAVAKALNNTAQDIDTEKSPVSRSYALANVPSDTSLRLATEDWMIFPSSDPIAVEQVSKKLVYNGIETGFSGYPYSSFGDLVVFNRSEIDGIRAFINGVKQYSDSSQTAPFSVALFGQPGSGKSFAVKEIMKHFSMVAGKETCLLTFNLSQLELEDFDGCFEIIRDATLRGNLPFVLWDEFDSHKLSYLAKFLAPMQDGARQDPQGIHPFGKAVFIFAGGVYSSLKEMQDKAHLFKEAKVPDFLSRLKGYLDIAGINPDSVGEDPIKDFSYIVRRALILRSVLERLSENKGNLFSLIDSGVLFALLNVKMYQHGVRSMEAVIKACDFSTGSILRSSLPSKAVLGLHVSDAEEFLRIAYGELEEGKKEELAIASYLALYNLRAHSTLALKNWDELEDEEKEIVEDVVAFLWSRVISDQLPDFRGVPWPVAGEDVIFNEAQILTLAHLQHEQWRARKYLYKPSHVIDELLKKNNHPDLAPFELIEAEFKEILLKFVRCYPNLLRKCQLGLIREKEESDPEIVMPDRVAINTGS